MGWLVVGLRYTYPVQYISTAQCAEGGGEGIEVSIGYISRPITMCVYINIVTQ